MMSQKHLKKGDALPPLSKDTLRIYSMAYCPYAHRTRLVLTHKKIPHEVVNINLSEKPDWFLEKNPVGTVPVLEYNDKILWESAVCNDFLDEVYPNDQLNPKDPYLRARQRILLERWGKVVTLYYATLRSLSNPEELKKKQEEMQGVLQVIENELKDEYFAGDSVGMIDFNIWAHAEKMHSVQIGGLVDMLGEYKTKFPRLAGWIDRMLEEPSAKATYVSPSSLIKLYASYGAGKPQYDDL